MKNYFGAVKMIVENKEMRIHAAKCLALAAAGTAVAVVGVVALVKSVPVNTVVETAEAVVETVA